MTMTMSTTTTTTTTTTSMSTSTNTNTTTIPHVVIAGAGPAGLLSAILLSNRGVRVTVLEKSVVADPWSTKKSYTISLNPERGLAALHHAGPGVVEAIKAAGMARNQVVMETFDGKQRKIPKASPNYALTRPDLVECLEGILVKDHSQNVTIQRGVAVTDIAASSISEDELEVTLDDNNNDGSSTTTTTTSTTVTCTHIIGADGKWSGVRSAIPELNDQFQVQSEPAFGISITASTAESPKRWDRDATSIFRPQHSSKFYVLVAPIPDGNSFFVSAVCFDEIQDEYPWLLPEADATGVDWEAEYGERNTSTGTGTGGTGSDDDAAAAAEAVFQANFAKMLQEELPVFYKDIMGDDNNDNDENAVLTARVNRRISWLRPLVETPRYCDDTGRVVLLGDAAHAMTPAVGEGCNCALESAVVLVQSITTDTTTTTTNDLSRAFQDFGSKRPADVVPIQMRSAAANRYKERKAPPSSAK